MIIIINMYVIGNNNNYHYQFIDMYMYVCISLNTYYNVIVECNVRLWGE